MATNAIGIILCYPTYLIQGGCQPAELMKQDAREVFPGRYHFDGAPVSRVADCQPACLVHVDLHQN